VGDDATTRATSIIYMGRVGVPEKTKSESGATGCSDQYKNRDTKYIQYNKIKPVRHRGGRHGFRPASF
jgi:hypothetical protein